MRGEGRITPKGKNAYFEKELDISSSILGGEPGHNCLPVHAPLEPFCSSRSMERKLGL